MNAKAACHIDVLHVATCWRKAVHERLPACQELTTRCHKLPFRSALSKCTCPELPIPYCWSPRDWISPVTPFSVEGKQAESKRSPRTQRLLRDIMHSSTKRSLRGNDFFFPRKNKTAVYLVPCIAEQPRNRRFKSLTIETLKRSVIERAESCLTLTSWSPAHAHFRIQTTAALIDALLLTSM